jgi:hypothetical protein
MALTPTEARQNFTRLMNDLAILRDSLTPDADGKVRVTGEEARRLLKSLPANLFALILDIVD